MTKQEPCVIYHQLVLVLEAPQDICEELLSIWCENPSFTTYDLDDLWYVELKNFWPALGAYMIGELK